MNRETHLFYGRVEVLLAAGLVGATIVYAVRGPGWVTPFSAFFAVTNFAIGMRHLRIARDYGR